MNKTKLLILTTVFIDVAGVGIVIPILPYYVMRFSSSPFLITSLFSIYAACSFFSAPVIGAISDTIGRKIAFITSVFSTSLGWFVFAAAPSIPFLFLGRIIDGAAAGNFPIAQAYMSDLSRDDRERTANLGLVGGVIGLAFIVGPLLGGVLGSVSHTFPFWFVGALAFANATLGIFFLPETNKKFAERRRPSLELQEKHSHILKNVRMSLNPFVPLLRAAKDKSLRPNYWAWFLFGLAFATLQSVFALYAKAVFGFNEFIAGIMFACVGVIIALNQIVALRHFWLKYFEEPALELVMLPIFAGGFLVMAGPSVAFFITGLMMTALGQSVLRVVMNSQIAAKADPNMKGEVLGVTASIIFLSVAIAPLFWGYLFGIDRRIPFVTGATFLLGAFFVLYRNRAALRKIHLSETEPVISEI